MDDPWQLCRTFDRRSDELHSLPSKTLKVDEDFRTDAKTNRPVVAPLNASQLEPGEIQIKLADFTSQNNPATSGGKCAFQLRLELNPNLRVSASPFNDSPYQRQPR